MKKRPVLCLPFLVLLVTGCPHNQYIVEMIPHGDVIERKLVFYREDGVNTNGTPNYQSFPLDELALIGKCYPRGSLKREGERHTATGRFSGVLPGDAGGGGSYARFSNTLGEAAFYLERFRGDDDFSGRMTKRSHQIDQLVDLVIGWSRKEFGGERHYQDLRKFLDEDFRRDMRNLAFYLWMFQASPTAKPEVHEEFAVRFGQYLVERGYLRMEDLPGLFGAFTSEDGRAAALLVQRLISSKLQVSQPASMPDALKSLADPNLLASSWTAYLETTHVYQSRLRQWQTKKIRWDIAKATHWVAGLVTARTNLPAPAAPPSKPDPSEVAADLTAEMLAPIDFWGTDDHLTVRLSLPGTPTRTNGKWNDAAKQVLWEADLEARTNTARMPAFCYASWSQPNEVFQTKHLGKLAMKGDDLLEYSLWRGALDAKQASEWEALLVHLEPGDQLRPKLDSFRFSSERRNKKSTSAADLPRGLIENGLEDQPAGNGEK
ncbi:conserved hypothetical protein [Verrucomicrobia bacterium]|nr:conserved hypothetical protein [Verrucomicrobiota bacterium]